MKKTALIVSIGVTALLCLQTFWLYNLYDVYKQQEIQVIDDLFDIAIEKELSLRVLSPFSNDKETPFIIHPDSFSLEEMRIRGLDRCYSDISTQVLQDRKFFRDPIQFHKLDSLFTVEINRKKIGATVARILYYDQFLNNIDEFGKDRPTNSSTIFTSLKQIGIQGSHFVRAAVILPPKQILEYMQYALIASFCIVCIVLFVLYYQWFVIIKEEKLLVKRKRIVYEIIHDLKSPLNSLYTSLDFIETDQTEPEQITLLNKGKKRISQIAAFVDQMLDIFRENVAPLQQIELHLPEFTETIWQDIRCCYPDKTIRFNIINRLSAETVFTDPIRLERCLRNLFDNALKYSDQDVSITVTLNENENKPRIEIKDTGWGIPKNHLKKLGNLFYRVGSSTKPMKKGYGIGLSSVKDLLREMGGSLQIESTEGIGSVFTIQL